MDKENPIFRSLAFIEEQIHEKLTVENLAKSANFSKYHYQRMFREAVGESVMQYVTRRRISLAARDLAEGKANVLDIALKYGYDSHEGFTRSFRTYMGVTPAEYRKYHHVISSPLTGKEKTTMLLSDSAGEIIRELNGLIVQTKETAAYAKKHAAPEGVTAYLPFWNFIASRTGQMADELSDALDRITSIAQSPDEISARFLIVKAIDDTVFWYGLMAFQAGLTVSRAKPEHRTLFEPICGKYDKLAADARLRADKIVDFFNELSSLLFRDMEENAQRKLQAVIQKGTETANLLAAEPDLPYTYIAEEIRNITQALSAAPFREITGSLLEECLLRLNIIAFAADIDAWRSPSHQQLLANIGELKECLQETVEFFQSLPADAPPLSAPEKASVIEYTLEKKCRNIAFQGNILLFHLRGEIQKLGSRILDEDVQTALNTICTRFCQTIQLAYRAENEADVGQLLEELQDLYAAMTAQAKHLDRYGAPIQYIAEEVKKMT